MDDTRYSHGHNCGIAAWCRCLIGLLCLTCLSPAFALNWVEAAPGMQVATLSLGKPYTNSKLVAFRFNPKQYRMRLVTAESLGHRSLFIDQFSRKVLERMDASSSPYLAINGGFFTPDYRPLGLRLQDRNILTPSKPISWWGIFYVQSGKARIVTPKYFQQSVAPHRLSMAIQVGPRLVINGRIPSLKPGKANRSALCIDKRGRVLVIATQHAPMTTETLATYLGSHLRQDNFGCYNAINLDGGSSTQLVANLPNKKLSIPSFRRVADAILVTPQ